MKFGVFDHVDDSGLPLAEHLEARLRMAEAYDALGFHCYHVAEHHGTPLGLAALGLGAALAVGGVVWTDRLAYGVEALA